MAGYRYAGLQHAVGREGVSAPWLFLWMGQTPRDGFSPLWGNMSGKVEELPADLLIDKGIDPRRRESRLAAEACEGIRQVSDCGNLLGPELLHVFQLIQGFTLGGSVCPGDLREPGLLSAVGDHRHQQTDIVSPVPHHRCRDSPESAPGWGGSWSHEIAQSGACLAHCLVACGRPSSVGLLLASDSQGKL